MKKKNVYILEKGVNMENKIMEMDDKEYFEYPGVNNSFLIKFDKSPLHALAEKETTKAMIEGSINHHYVLQNKTFFDNYHILPKEIKVQNPKFGNYKEWLEKNSLSHEKDKEKIIKKTNIDRIIESNKEIIDNINSYYLSENLGRLKKYYEESLKEVVILWEDMNIQRKSKIDMLWQDKEKFIIFDLKFCQDAIDWQWSLIAQSKNNAYKYYRQAASYLSAAEKVLNKLGIFLFIAVEKKPPFAVKAYQMTDYYIDFGKKEDMKSLLNYKKWLDLGSPHYSYSGIDIIDLPKYLKNPNEKNKNNI